MWMIRDRRSHNGAPEILRAAAMDVAHLAAVHLADSKGDDLALIWAREHAKVYRALWSSHMRALRRNNTPNRRLDAARMVL
jgi:hypothetical protein